MFEIKDATNTKLWVPNQYGRHYYAAPISKFDGMLTFNAPIMTEADDSHIFSYVLEKIRLDISCESYAGQRTHMKHQALFSVEDKS